MIERLLLLLAVTALVTVGVLLTRAWVGIRTRRVMAAPPSRLLQALQAEADGRPSLITFSTPSCAACHTAQHPAADAVARELGTERVRVVHVDASTQSDIAHAFGVLTVPSSVILDATGRITAINHGFAPSRQLLEQLQSE
jgi:thiol-disulfide isomerase/thioredoxin